MGWPICSLGDVCTFENGDRGKNYPSRSQFVEHGVPFINAGHLENGEIISESVNFITPQNYDLLSRGKFQIGDVLFCLRGSLGKYAVVGSNIPEGAIPSSLVIIRPYIELVDIGFLLLYLQSEQCSAMIKKYEGGAAQPNLGAKDLSKFIISLPPIQEQKRIVAILDQAFADIEKVRVNTEQNLKNTRELFDSYLQQIFSQRNEGWVERKLMDVCVLQRGFDLPKRLRTQGDYPLVSSSGVTDSHIEAKVTGPGVVTGRSGSIGNVFFIDNDFWPLNTALYILKNFMVTTKNLLHGYLGILICLNMRVAQEFQR